uniref:Uncharacterized protein n=1 Tax=Kalanchoe fedtschenkoi TaxID=63787 RepID=A0A7N0TY19_KALFE
MKATNGRQREGPEACSLVGRWLCQEVGVAGKCVMERCRCLFEYFANQVIVESEAQKVKQFPKGKRLLQKSK